MRVVLVPERLQLAREIDCVPEEHPIEILAANGADQALVRDMATTQGFRRVASNG